MKTFSFLKAFVISAMALATITGCSKDDSKDEPAGAPSILVNGKASELVTVGLTGGTLSPSVTVQSSNVWSMSLSANSSWLHPSITSGDKGASTLTFTADAVPAGGEARTAVVTLTTTGSIAGYQINATATINVRQGDASATNVAEIRTLLKAMNPGDAKVPVTEAIAAKTLTGIVVSNSSSGSNLGNKYLVAVVDATINPNSGLTISATKFGDLNLAPGTVVSAPLTAAQVQLYNGTLQLSIDNAAVITTTPGAVLEPITITVDKIADYASQYVKIEKCQAIDGAYGVAWYVADGNRGNVNFVNEAGMAFVVRSSQYATSYNAQIVPDKSGYILGVAGYFNDKKNESVQIMPTSAGDVSHLDQTRMAPKYQKVTINNLAAGNYEVDATIVGVHSKGVLLADNAGGQNNFVMGFFNAGNNYQDKLDYSATMQGACADRFGLWQFSEPTLTVGAKTTFALGTPAKFDAAAIAAYAAAVKYQYVELSGIVTITNVPASGTTAAYNKYDLAVAGSESAVNLAYGIDSYFPGIVSGDVITVKGFAIGYNTSKKELAIMVREAAKNTSTPIVTITSTPAAFTAAGNAQDVTYSAANIPAGSNVFAKVEGAGAGQFTLGAVADGKVAVTAKANDGAAQSATLTLYIATAAGAAAVASDAVALTQAAKPSGNELILTLDFAANRYDINLTPAADGSFTADGYTYNFGQCYYSNLSYPPLYLMMAAKSNDNSFLTLPAVAGKKLASVVATNNKGASAKAAIEIVPTDSATPVGGGESQTWSSVTEPVSVTFTLNGTAVNTAYKIHAVKGVNAQLSKVVITYN